MFNAFSLKEYRLIIYIFLIITHHKIMKKMIPILIISLFIIVSRTADQHNPRAKNFLVETKVMIDNKPFSSPTNISVFIDDNITFPSYSFNLSSQNFNKNVTVALRLFSWYNSQWTLSRQNIVLKITDRRNIFREKNRLLARILKYNSRKYESKMMEVKQQTLLNNTHILISYDPESSLLVSRLEDPSIFTQDSHYWPLQQIKQELIGKTISIKVSFGTIKRSDSFINSKNHIVSLNEVASKIKEKIPIISRPFGDIIDPIMIQKTFIWNYEGIKRSNKQYNQKVALMENRKYDGLLLPRLHRLPFSLPPIINSIASQFNVSLSDQFVPTYYYILQQGFILDNINNLQNFVRRKIADAEQVDYVAKFEEWAKIQGLVTFSLGLVWVFLDLISYLRIDKNPGMSRSFGFFLVVWIITENLSLSFRVGSTTNKWFGVGFFFVSLIILKLIATNLQRKFSKTINQGSDFDKGFTEICFNLIIIAIFANGIMHIFIDHDVKDLQLVLWALVQFQLLLQEYYYFFCMLPPLLLSLKLKSTIHIGWFRLLLFLLIALKDDYWLLIDNHWALIVLKLKEEILFILLLLLKIVVGNRPFLTVQITQVQQSKNDQKENEDQQREEIEQTTKKEE